MQRGLLLIIRNIQAYYFKEEQVNSLHSHDQYPEYSCKTDIKQDIPPEVKKQHIIKNSKYLAMVKSFFQPERPIKLAFLLCEAVR